MPRWSRYAIALPLLLGRCEASTERRDALFHCGRQDRCAGVIRWALRRNAHEKARHDDPLFACPPVQRRNSHRSLSHEYLARVKAGIRYRVKANTSAAPSAINPPAASNDGRLGFDVDGGITVRCRYSL